MSARHRPSQPDAQWETERVQRSTRTPFGDELSTLINDPNPLGPLTPELRADALRTAAEASTVTTAEQLKDIAQALGCGLGDVELGLQRLRADRARKKQESAA